MKSLTEKLIARSERHLKLFDRERFGEMALDRDLFAALQTKEIAFLVVSDNDRHNNPYRDEANDHWLAYDNIAAQYKELTGDEKEYAEGSNHLMLIGEMTFWWNKHKEALGDFECRGLNSNLQLPVVKVWYDRFATLYDHPEFAPYFKVGVFDYDIINHAISHDIDAALVNSVVMR